MPRGLLTQFHYRIDGKQYMFGAPDRDTADLYAKRWAKRMGYTRVTRLKRKDKV